MKNKQTVTIPLAYIQGLKRYMNRVGETIENEYINKMAVVVLIGYLEALILLKDEQNEK